MKWDLFTAAYVIYCFPVCTRQGFGLNRTKQDKAWGGSGRPDSFTGSAYLYNATDEDVVALVVDPVLQHHFVHHGDENLVLKR